MIPGLTFTGSDRVRTLDVKANVNNISIGPTLGGATYLNYLAHPIDLHILVRAGVILGAALKPGFASPDPALVINLPAGSRVFISNLGRIAGGGGIGGKGDRGKRIDETASNFVGGGGGGGAGSSSQGGSAATESDPDDDSTDGAAGTATVGGNAGVNDSGPDIGNGPFVRGTAAQFGGDAISFGTSAIEIFIDNEFGEIWAGANGGEGGYQNAPLPHGAIDPERGHDIAATVTTLTGSLTTEPKAIAYSNGSTLTWVPSGGASYPNVRGYINRKP